jgi:hypothetical protein
MVRRASAEYMDIALASTFYHLYTGRRGHDVTTLSSNKQRNMALNFYHSSIKMHSYGWAIRFYWVLHGCLWYVDNNILSFQELVRLYKLRKFVGESFCHYV